MNKSNELKVNPKEVTNCLICFAKNNLLVLNFEINEEILMYVKLIIDDNKDISSEDNIFKAINELLMQNIFCNYKLMDIKLKKEYITSFNCSKESINLNKSYYEIEIQFSKIKNECTTHITIDNKGEIF